MFKMGNLTTMSRWITKLRSKTGLSSQKKLTITLTLTASVHQSDRARHSTFRERAPVCPQRPAPQRDLSGDVANTPVVSTGSRFLDLPSELRNEIYALVLVSDGRLTITPANNHRPALLQVNQQIQSEAWHFYYLQNEFMLETVNYDLSNILAFERHARKWRDTMWSEGRGVSHLHRLSSGSWENLLEWLRRVHENGSFMAWNWDDTCNEQLKATARLFVVVRDLADLEWSRVVPVLLQYKLGMQELVDGDWSWD